MNRIGILMLAVAVAGFVAATTPPQAVRNEIQSSGLDALKKQRVRLLKDRVASIKTLVIRERAGSSDLIRLEMDVINAQLDYAEPDAERKELLNRLLSKYDALIELKKRRFQSPRKSDLKNPNKQMWDQSDLLYLKADRIRVQILHDSLD